MDSNSTFALHTGRKMPVLGLGTWQLTDDTPGTIERALELGYRMIDTSGDYGTQPGIAEGLRRSGVARADLYIVTKVEEDEDSYSSARRQVAELGLDYADLILIHRPPEQGPGKDLWEGLIRAREEGVTRDIGVSNYSIEQLDELATSSGEVPSVNQIEWTPFGWSPEMLEHCRDRNILIQAYSPVTRNERLDDARLTDIARTYGKTPGQLLIRWNLQLGVVPLPKANSLRHLEENLDVFDFEIADEHMQALGRLNEEWSSLGSGLQYT